MLMNALYTKSFILLVRSSLINVNHHRMLCRDTAEGKLYAINNGKSSSQVLECRKSNLYFGAAPTQSLVKCVAVLKINDVTSRQTEKVGLFITYMTDHTLPLESISFSNSVLRLGTYTLAVFTYKPG